MPAWPGGPCPECGDQMPAMLIRCATCRGLLNPELVPKEIAFPDFVPLPEVVVDVQLKGDYIRCPQCEKELRISYKFRDKHVSCKFCSHAFKLNLASPTLQHRGIYVPCPHCQKELRVAERYLGEDVACNFCNGAIRILDVPAPK